MVVQGLIFDIPVGHFLTQNFVKKSFRKPQNIPELLVVPLGQKLSLLSNGQQRERKEDPLEQKTNQGKSEYQTERKEFKLALKGMELLS